MTDSTPDPARLARMVRIPAGRFLSGSLNTPMELGEYWIDRYPVTNADFARVFPEHRYTLRRAQHPVTWVEWSRAQDYLAALGLQLPSQTQWEKAARGCDGNLYPWGMDHDPRRFNVFESDVRETTAVTAYEPSGASPYGVVDLAGNVWEWTATADALEGAEVGEGRIVCGGSHEMSWFEMQSGMATQDVLRADCGYATVGFRGVWMP